MAELNKDYKCSICGNVVKVIEAGSGALVCCGQPMEPVGEPAAPQTETTNPAPGMEATTETPASNMGGGVNPAPDMGAANVNEAPSTDTGMSPTGSDEETKVNQ